jgi:hypothetical protein
VIVETPTRHRPVELSQGTHFFQNLTAFHLGYLTLSGPDDRFDRAWLDALPAVREGIHVRHVRTPEGLVVMLDGKRGRAAVLKRAPPEPPHDMESGI